MKNVGGGQQGGVPEQRLERRLAARIFGGSQKALDRARKEADRTGKRPAEFANDTYLSVQTKSGGTIYTIKGASGSCVDEIVRALTNNEMEKIRRLRMN